MLQQIISLVGAFLILLAYLANAREWLGPKDPWYNFMNLAGALLLLYTAILDRSAGFVFLESAWALIALPPLFRFLKKAAK